MKAALRRKGSRLVMAVGVLGAGAALASLGLGGTAHADPAYYAGSFVVVGGDGLQDVFNAFAGESPSPPAANSQFYTPLHSSSATNNETISSFDAYPPGGSVTAPGCITTKLGGPSFDRPSSSSNGVKALNAAISGSGWEASTASCTNALVNVTGQIDIARDASGPATTGTTLTFIPFARDGVGYAYWDHDTGDASSLTTAQLTALYSSSTGSITLGDGDTLLACLALPGSALRKTFENAIGVTDSVATVAATANGCNSLPQNDGNTFYSQFSSEPVGTDVIVPFFASSWIAQADQIGTDNTANLRSAGGGIGTIDGLSPLTGTIPNLVPNTAYYQSGYGANDYVVVPTNKVTGAFANKALESLFVGSSSSICSTAAQTTVHLFGYDSLTGSEGSCGTTTQEGNS
jgi:hypothetical protein